MTVFFWSHPELPWLQSLVCTKLFLPTCCVMPLPQSCAANLWAHCCLHGWLGASTTVITQHICKAQRLSDMPAPSNTRKHSTWTQLIYLQQNDPPTHADCFQKIRICHALLHLAFHASLMKYWHFSNNIFFSRKIQENKVLSYNGNSLKYRPKYLHGPLA